MRVYDLTTKLRQLHADADGVVAVEYALIAAMIVFSIVAILRFIGADAMLGLPPIINALQGAAP